MAAEPGWFPDPDRPNEWRYWTGTAWAPRPPPGPSQPAANASGHSPSRPQVTIVTEEPLPTDAYVWAMALLPLGAGLTAALVGTLSSGTSDAAMSITWWATLLTPFVLTSLDQRGITESGRWAAWGWIFLAPPAYLINRYIKLRGSSPAPMLVSVATYAIWIILAIALSAT